LKNLKARDILQFMKSVTVSLYPFQGNDTTARAFFAMVKNPKATDANENCTVKMTLLPKWEPATVQITWEDSSEQKFDVEDLSLPKLMQEVKRKRNTLSLQQKLREIKSEWEPELDPFEESKMEMEKKHAEKLRKAGADKKSKVK